MFGELELAAETGTSCNADGFSLFFFFPDSSTSIVTSGLALSIFNELELAAGTVTSCNADDFSFFFSFPDSSTKTVTFELA